MENLTPRELSDVTVNASIGARTQKFHLTEYEISGADNFGRETLVMKIRQYNPRVMCVLASQNGRDNCQNEYVQENLQFCHPC